MCMCEIGARGMREQKKKKERLDCLTLKKATDSLTFYNKVNNEFWTLLNRTEVTVDEKARGGEDGRITSEVKQIQWSAALEVSPERESSSHEPNRAVRFNATI